MKEGEGKGKEAFPCLSSPLPPRSFTHAIFRAVFHPRSSFFAMKLQGNTGGGGTGGGGALETLLRRLGNNRNSHCTFLLIGNPCLYLPYYRFSFSSSYKK